MSLKPLPTVVVILIGIPLYLGGQITPSTAKAAEHTVLERFDPDLVPPVAERKQLRRSHEKRIEMAARIIDTLSVSERHRRRLFRDLTTKPYSERLSEIMVQTEFED